MESTAQTLKAALGTAAGVWLGPEHLVKQPDLPHVVVVPTGEDLEPPTQNAVQVAGKSSLTVDLICRAGTYQDARLLALLCWQVPGLIPGGSPSARLRYGTETWGTREVRSVTLTLTGVPVTLLRTDVTLARIEEIAAHHRYTLTTTEAPDETEPEGNGDYFSDFHEHDDPPHRLP